MKCDSTYSDKNQMFKALKQVIANLKQIAEKSGAIIFCDDTPVSPDQIVVDSTGIFVRIDGCIYTLYEHTPDWDHGWYDSHEQNIAQIKGHFKLYKELQY